MNTDLVSHINTSLEISLPETLSQEELREKLAAHINHLINHDFEKLVYYLYRIDVDENKMRRLLEQRIRLMPPSKSRKSPPVTSLSNCPLSIAR